MSLKMLYSISSILNLFANWKALELGGDSEALKVDCRARLSKEKLGTRGLRQSQTIS